MQIAQWDSFRDLATLHSRLSRTLDDSAPPRSRDFFRAWAPPVDIFEKNDQLVIRAEIPGVHKEDLDVRIENGVLSLHGERKQEIDVKSENSYRLERTYGTFSRSFSLPTTVDATKVTATCKDGILEVTVPKVESAKPKKIEINAA